ncbi:MAG: 50S ribosomal protein L4 [Bacteroidetes Order II. Incertae sedis bacterium]|jgi:large subunit ribosomal protein L4|nr:50S ribosomal protein L4 [Bacteroidetes Order II. bacterium]MBT5249326.1 50S ribosomal protein L4 [Bacteroidetes Order II. bacterium]MBT6200809.1 50S ribosomal protein L4 [Bacteroidetes Order II. bacterium]MBT6423749.1 50S ribosomal protein L4 [Bacteroidetes Order II. bacterium]MBT6598160.1 50S ribosomal protein L4 [Bacteroidetes Order II. bacterium]
MKLKVFKQDGTTTKKSVALDEAVFAVEPNDHAIWLDVRRIQANGRQGTHKSKERGEVAGSTRKLYRQKGTGHARAGSAKSPIRKSGGTIFGPRPRNYTFKINRKTQHVARRSALTYKAKGDAIRVVENFSYEAPSTSDLKGLLSGMELAGKSVLLLTGNHESAVYRSGRNVPKLTVRNASEVSTLDVMKAQVVVMQVGAVETLASQLGAAKQ